MSASSLLQLYAEQAVLLAVGGAAFRGAWAWASRRRVVAARVWRDAALVVILAAVVLPVLARWMPAAPEREALRFGAAPSSALERPAPPAAGRSAFGLPEYRVSLTTSQDTAARAALATAAIGIVSCLAAAASRRRRLRQVLEGLPVARRIGRVTIAASDDAPVPYAARAAGRAWVVVPTDLLDDAGALRLLVAHELQHHRQRDLQLLSAIERVGAFFFWNPAAAAWARLVEELQEVACDAAVLSRRRGQAGAYGELLLRAADVTGRTRFVPGGATAATGRSTAVLKRRMAMLTIHDECRRGFGGWAAAAAAVSLVAAGAIAARSAVIETRLGERDIARLSASLAARGLTVPVNDVVVDEVNRWLATPKDRLFLKEASARLAERQALVQDAFARHQVPAALAAVAIVESGFRNLEQKQGFRAAGVWQFIPDTARSLGLKVDEVQDERLDLPKQTEAAARLLAGLHQQLGDWPLAVAAYNEGGRRVAQVVADENTRDAWALMRAGKLGRYAASVVAAALVLENPSLVDGPAAHAN